MGLIDLKQVIDAFKNGVLESLLAEYDLNGIALLRHELEGYANRNDTQDDFQALIEFVDRIIIQRREESSSR